MGFRRKMTFWITSFSLAYKYCTFFCIFLFFIGKHLIGLNDWWYMGGTSSQVTWWRMRASRCRWMVMHEVHWSISPSVTLPWLTRFYPWWITLVKQQREDRPGVSSLIKNELNYSELPYETSLPDLSLSIRFLLDLMYDKHCLLAFCSEKMPFILHFTRGKQSKSCLFVSRLKPVGLNWGPL